MSFPEKKKDFNIFLVRDKFTEAGLDLDQISLRRYVDAFRELCRFFRLTGTLFGFVANDLESKLNILDHHMSGSEAQHYRSIQSMIEFEVTNSFTQRVLPGSIKSGSRTLLRLHRALEFILQFMERLAKSDDDQKASTVAAEVYDKTLAHHHPWIVRGMAHLAVKMLPTRRKLVEVMCAHDHEQVHETSLEVAAAGQRLYDVVQTLYDEQQLHTLP